MGGARARARAPRAAAAAPPTGAATKATTQFILCLASVWHCFASAWLPPQNEMSVKLMQLNCLYAHDEEQTTPWRSRCAVLRRWIAHLDPDVVTLQEITVGTRADTGAEVNMLADICSGSALTHQIFGPACDEVMPFVSDGQQQGVILGNAIASRWPIAAHVLSPQLPWQRATVGRGFASKRSAIWARIDSPYGPFGCCSTHLDSTGPHDDNRLLQMAAVIAFVEQQHKLIARAPASLPPILCGDMNCNMDSDAIQYAFGNRTLDGAASPISMVDAMDSLHTRTPENHTGDGIDYILVGFPACQSTVETCKIVQDSTFGEWPSDHPAILAQLRAAPHIGKL
eukprot:COSAG01_NODE_3626_length_5856_cov_134.101963_2_plen_341_part_00